MLVISMILISLLILGLSIILEEIMVFATRHRKLVRVVLLVVAVAIYLNVGWAYGTYSAMHLGKEMSQATILQKFLIGPDKVFSVVPNPSLLAFQILYMIAWPLWLGITVLVWVWWLLVMVAAWMLRLVLLLVSDLWQIVVFAFRLLFAGGIAKLLGVG